jgi:hypothetical protein
MVEMVGVTVTVPVPILLMMVVKLFAKPDDPAWGRVTAQAEASFSVIRFPRSVDKIVSRLLVHRDSRGMMPNGAQPATPPGTAVIVCGTFAVPVGPVGKPDPDPPELEVKVIVVRVVVYPVP